MDEITMNIFPRSDIEALALLYVQNQDLKDVTPEGLLEMYDNTVETMANVRKLQEYTKGDWF